MAQIKPNYGVARKNGGIKQGEASGSTSLRQEKVQARRAQAATISRNARSANLNNDFGNRVAARRNETSPNDLAQRSGGNLGLMDAEIEEDAAEELSDTSVDEEGNLVGSDVDEDSEDDEEISDYDDSEEEYDSSDDEDEDDFDDNEDEEDDEQSGRIRSSFNNLKRLAKAKQSQMMAEKMSQTSVDPEGNLVSNTFSMGTDWLLRQSWINLIDTFGATLIWINIHVFLGFVFGEQYFKKLGHEWASGGVMKAETAIAGAEAKEALKAAGDKVGFAEVMLVILMDAIVIFALLWFAVQIIFLIAVVQKVGTFGVGAVLSPAGKFLMDIFS